MRTPRARCPASSGRREAADASAGRPTPAGGGRPAAGQVVRRGAAGRPAPVVGGQVALVSRSRRCRPRSLEVLLAVGSSGRPATVGPGHQTRFASRAAEQGRDVAELPTSEGRGCRGFRGPVRPTPRPGAGARRSRAAAARAGSGPARRGRRRVGDRRDRQDERRSGHDDGPAPSGAARDHPGRPDLPRYVPFRALPGEVSLPSTVGGREAPPPRVAGNHAHRRHRPVRQHRHGPAPAPSAGEHALVGVVRRPPGGREPSWSSGSRSTSPRTAPRSAWGGRSRVRTPSCTSPGASSPATSPLPRPGRGRRHGRRPRAAVTAGVGHLVHMSSIGAYSPPRGRDGTRARRRVVAHGRHRPPATAWRRPRPSGCSTPTRSRTGGCWSPGCARHSSDSAPPGAPCCATGCPPSCRPA